MVAPKCEKCEMPHARIIVNGDALCPEKDKGAYDKALTSWEQYEKLLAERRKEGR